ncbi:MAG TPA: DJ-1 family protein [Verrucomicrobia bacterium]|nr:DJ-1 family protein [Verrucomicrobiota bacterium]
MPASVLIPLAHGVEEMEAVIVIDVLRRAGWNVVSAAVGNELNITASRGVTFMADGLWTEVAAPTTRHDAIVIVGGLRGTRALCGDTRVLEALRTFAQQGKWIGSICAGPLVLQAAGVLNGCHYTCYPGIESEITGSMHHTEPVVHDPTRRLITSQGPGTAFLFALALVEAIDGRTAADRLREQLRLVA